MTKIIDDEEARTRCLHLIEFCDTDLGQAHPRRLPDWRRAVLTKEGSRRR
jgi:hypothetical protein